ncbi:MAG TPA: AsmA family protein [Candidatus Sulfotelmatobacter sp.]|nr:AsmA family protein [Candidatus Sulfotelmatobacter sp.]
MKLLSSKRRLAVVAAGILLLLFLVRPGASRLKARIISSISAGVGRNVDVGSVYLRVLPRPGFDLKNLVVYDDPAFGAEPMLRATEVTADLRLTSLLRGRLEIARLDLNEPSLNLVHRENGRWNLEALLERAARTPLAPTAKAKLEPRPGFPYIEASSARINFKSGVEKKPYALTNADFSLWQESEDTWGVRLKAQPVRSDLNLNDLGILLVNGTWRRAASLRDTPLQFSVEWSRAQLGQITKFFTGNDQGWRGGVQFDVTLTGTPAQLHLTSDAAVQDFRRYDITRGEVLPLAAHCDGQYSSLNHVFHELVCLAPVGNGVVTLKGDVGLPGSHYFGLVLSVENLPASPIVSLVQRVKKNLPDDLAAEGVVHGSVLIQEDAAAGSILQIEGRGGVSDLRLASAVNKAEIGPEMVPFVVTTGELVSSTREIRASHVRAVGPQGGNGLRIEFGPFPVAIGRGVSARGWINRTGYGIAVAGEADVAKTLRTARMFGIPATPANAEGAAQLDLQIAGTWAYGGPGTTPPVTGTVKLHNVRVGVRGVAGPVEISSAEVQLSNDVARVSKLSAKVADTTWNGSMEMPRGCGTPGACQVHFNVNAGQISLAEMSEWLSPRTAERPWYRVLTSGDASAPSFLSGLRASGRVAADRIVLHSMTATHFAANLNLDHGKLRVSDIAADILGGNYRGEWQADFSIAPALCNGGGTLSGLSLAQLPDSTKDRRIAGSANGSYELKGACGGEFWQSAEGVLRFEIRDGAMPHMSLAEDEGPLKIVRLSGEARLHLGKLEVKDARLDSANGSYWLSGTASLQRELELKLAAVPSGSRPSYAITGTLAQPLVAPLTGTEQARLKPDPAK